MVKFSDRILPKQACRVGNQEPDNFSLIHLPDMILKKTAS